MAAQRVYERKDAEKHAIDQYMYLKRDKITPAVNQYADETNDGGM